MVGYSTYDTAGDYQAVLWTVPSVLSVSPSSGPSTGGTTVTITGTDLAGATAVDFGTTPATSFTVNSAGTQITATSPAGTGTVNVTVVNADGTSATNTGDEFRYTTKRDAVIDRPVSSSPAIDLSWVATSSGDQKKDSAIQALDGLLAVYGV
ncbi:MAG: IPT/TIG domain-containing protein, partial [Thermoguttaceae bacterium]